MVWYCVLCTVFWYWVVDEFSSLSDDDWYCCGGDRYCCGGSAVGCGGSGMVLRCFGVLIVV
jgi:hypothetical protein